MSKTWFWSLLSIFLLAAALQGQARESLLKTVAQNSKWSPADKPVQYDEKTLETLEGKRAATIKRYGFTGVTIQNWSGTEGNVRLTLYEMMDAGAAYGLFTLERSRAQAGMVTIPIGTEGFRAGSRAFVWQSKYVAKFEGPVVAADAFARVVSESIFGRSRKPPVSSHFPPENLVQGSERYVVDETGIGRDLELNPQTLGFDDSAEAAIADYRVNGKTAHLVLLMYPTQQVAKKYEDEWTSSGKDEPAFRKRVGPLIALVRR